MSYKPQTRYFIVAHKPDNSSFRESFDADQKQKAWNLVRSLATEGYETISYEKVVEKPFGGTNPRYYFSTVNIAYVVRGIGPVSKPEGNACVTCGAKTPVPHYGSRMCKSGKRPHCTCDLCY